MQISNKHDFILVTDFNKEKGSLYESLGLTGKKGEPYKTVNVEKTTKTFTSNSIRVPIYKITYKNKIYNIIENKFEFLVETSNIPFIIEHFNCFGSVNRTINGIRYDGTLRYIDNALVDSHNNKLIIGRYEKNDNKEVNHLMTLMDKDGGRLAQPLIKKYISMLHILGGQSRLYTGYANANDYLSVLKQPSLKPIKNKNGFITLKINEPKIKIIIDLNIVNDEITMNVTTSGVMVDDRSMIEPVPYILVTTKPFMIGSERLPFIPIRLNGVTLFLNMMNVTNNKLLIESKGFFNLLG